MKASSRALRTGLLALVLAGAAAGHDYWILPSSLHPASGERVDLRLFVGERFVPEDERAFQREKTPRFELVHAPRGDRVEPVAPPRPRDLVAECKEDARPFGAFVVDDDGGWLVVMDRAPATIELAPDKFEEYLKEEGLDTIVAERARLGESAKPGRERYRRCLKSLVRAGTRADGAYATCTGQEIELVPAADPSLLVVPVRLEVKASFRGKPLAGLQVAATRAAAGKPTTLLAKSDAEGRVAFDLDVDGTWLLTAVHMVRGDEPKVADWESYWTSFTFAPMPKEPVKAPAK